MLTEEAVLWRKNGIKIWQAQYNKNLLI